MKERGIPFAAPMVRAVLAGTKTQTRRVVKPAPFLNTPFRRIVAGVAQFGTGDLVTGPSCERRCPYGVPGDRLWVREAFRFLAVHDHVPPRELSSGPIRYAAGPLNDTAPADGLFGKLRPGMFLPRWASRITLDVTGVRVERLQDISEADCWAEGIQAVDGVFDGQMHEMAKRIGCTFEDARATYACLWESINGLGSWDANPWVWVVEFQRTPEGRR